MDKETNNGEARRLIIRSGYDHYWNSHTHNEKRWAKKGCPICNQQIKLLEVK